MLKDLQIGISKFSAFMRGFSIKETTQSAKDLINAQIEEIAIIRQKIKDLKSTNIKLGIKHFDLGFIDDSIFRFKIVKKIWPDAVIANYYLGRSYVEKYQYEKASPYIDEYLKSGHQDFIEEAKYCYDVIHNRVNLIKSIPESLVKRYYTLIIEMMDALIQIPNPCPQELLVSRLNSELTKIGKPYGNSFLDIGCGTGFVAEKIRQKKMASSIEGLDFNRDMIDKSASKKFEDFALYDKLSEISFHDFSIKSSDSYDVIIASEFLNTNSEIGNLLNFSKNHLNKNGIIGLVIKTAETIAPFEFNRELEEFFFSLEFLNQTFAEFRLNVLTQDKVTFSDSSNGAVVLLSKISS